MPQIAILHPDLGIGGAERLIVDTAIGLQNQGHQVVIYTSHCDKSHCFEEVKSGQLKVEVYGDFIPTNFAKKFKILFASLRQLYLVLVLILTAKVFSYDYFIVDQLSTCLPLLHVFQSHKARILFYCHFPDQRLAKHDGLIRKLYRFPFDLIEQLTMSSADAIVVNSNFTKSVYNETFPYIKDLKIPGIIYPCVDLTKEPIKTSTETFYKKLLANSSFFLSINRFERKKNIELSIKSFKQFIETFGNKNALKLVLSGGYDSLVDENKEYLSYLQDLSASLGLKHKTIFSNEYENFVVSPFDVLFLPSISSNLKELLLTNTKLLLYTPSFEHFGIVPLEAMKFGTPILAVNNGGPVESIIPIDRNSNLGTGWLEPSDATKWSLRFDQALKLSKDQLIENGSKQLNSNFTLEVMTKNFEEVLIKASKQPRNIYYWEYSLIVAIISLFAWMKYNTNTTSGILWLISILLSLLILIHFII